MRSTSCLSGRALVRLYAASGSGASIIEVTLGAMAAACEARLATKNGLGAATLGRNIPEDFMTFCCLGWGSLIWCQKSLPVRGEWKTDGPALPVEFARQSKDKRITLVIYEEVPAVKVLWATLDVATLDEAKKQLRRREETSPENIGWWSPAGASRHTGAAEIGQWAARRNLEGVVWTALGPKIGEEYRKPKCEEVLQHLNDLKDTDRKRAEEYVRLAPRQIVTPYRTAIEEAFGWTATGLQ